ncbi:MAG TPA: hypothetical protein VGB15_16210 [Longimicrobium sp.]|jgi:hypothetical protein
MAYDVLLEEAASQVRRARWLYLLLGLPFLFSLLVAGIYLLSSLLQGQLLPTAAFAVVFALLTGGLLKRWGRGSISSARILWIRRFARGRRSRRVHALLSTAAIGTGNLITLGDSDVETDIAMSGTWWNVLMWTVNGITWSLLADGLPLPVGVALGALLALGEYTRYRWRRSRRLTPRHFRRKLERVLKKTRTGGFTDSVITCPKEGELWRFAITYLADRVDAVVISADRSSESLDYEIRQLLAAGRVSPRNILVLRDDPAAGDLLARYPALAGARTLLLPRRLSIWPLSRIDRALACALKAVVISPPGPAAPARSPGHALHAGLRR